MDVFTWAGVLDSYTDLGMGLAQLVGTRRKLVAGIDSVRAFHLERGLFSSDDSGRGDI
jgi:hypothetical protein